MKIFSRMTALVGATIVCTVLCAFSTVTVASGAASASPADWPRTYAGPDGGLLTVYQPQVDEWTDRVRMKAHAAVEVETGDKSTYGSVWIEAHTRSDARAGTVTLEQIELVRSSFPALPEARAAKVEGAIRAGMKESSLVLPLPSVLASLAKEEAGPEPELSEERPHIYYSATPALLVTIDGRSIMMPIPGTKLSYVVNTNWNLFLDDSNHEWYLLDGESWLTSHLYPGPWRPVKKLPKEFSKLPDDDEWKAVRAHVPGKPYPEGKAPKVFLVMGAAEIVLTDGPPQMKPIEGTKLMYAENSPNDLFLDTESNQFYVVFGGRWYSTASLDGLWSPLSSADLPADFSKIPPDSPRGSVLVSVPGTAEAREAALQAQVPHLATVDRKKATLDVVYAGEPDFEPIEGTDLTYAANTSYAVVHAGDMYYAVSDGIWFESEEPTGPWVVATVVPPAIYTIPPTSPLYPITFVRVYSFTPTTVVVGYTAGYLGTYVWGGTVVFGTGYYYRSYYVPGPVPVYFPSFRSYSVATWYNPATGAYGRGAAVVGPYGGAGAGWAYDPATGAYAHGARAYGPYGGAGYVAGYDPSTGAWGRAETQYGPDGRSTWAQGGNPWTGTYARTQQNRTPYAQWGSSTVTRGGETTDAAHYSNAEGAVGGFDSTTGTKGAGYHTESGKSGGVVKKSGGDVYADHDGNVYRHSSDDGWQKYDDGGWNDVQRPSGEARADGDFLSGLEQDRGARTAGRFGGALGGGRFEASRERRLGGGFAGGFGRGGGFGGRR